MKVLDIDATEYSPGVLMDPGENVFMIWGTSRPEDARAFYIPILEWLDEYYSLRYWKDDKFTQKYTDLAFEFKFDYLNSTSAKFILDILLKIGEFNIDNIELEAHWYYQEMDEDVKESGEAFEKLCKVPFKHIAMP